MPEERRLIPKILDHVREEIETQLPFKAIRGSYRASEIGDCERYLAYAQLGKPKELINPELELLFRDGHLHESAVIDLMRRVYIVTNQQYTAVKRYNVDGVEFNLTATMDCLVDGDDVVDVKSTNFFTGKQLAEKGKPYILEKYRGYYDQIQTYMQLYGKKRAALLFKEKMTSRLMEFWFKRNTKYFETVILKKIARIEKLVQLRKLPKKPFSKSSTECKRCTMRIHCWGVKMDQRSWS